MVKNASHTLAYSLIALQEMNLAFKYPIIFWNCACLISDSGGNEEQNEEESQDSLDEWTKEEPTYFNEMEDFTEEDEDLVEDSYEEEDCDGLSVEVKVLKDGKKKKQVKSNNYGKLASAIGKMKSAGIDISAPDINDSSYTFAPDADKSLIRFGLSGITKVSKELIQTIIANRPYASLKDFMERIKINKPQMVNLIKSGAFDCFGERTKIMHEYIEAISDTKKRITLQNMKMLIDFNLIPEEYDLQKRVYNFNKYIKKMKIDVQNYGLDNIALNFYEKNFDMDLLFPSEKTESGFMIKQTSWDSIYKKQMDIIRPFVKKHNEKLLKKVNEILVQNMWNKYCEGSISKWEMDAVSCYFHPHELIYVDEEEYCCQDFTKLPEEPIVDRVISIKGKQIPLFKITRIMGTVLDKNKTKKTVTLLTNSGVVTVRIFGEVFNHYDKQISEKGPDGKKHVIDKSIFSRGNKIIVTGIRRGSDFSAKKYSKTPFHLVERIVDINEDGSLVIQSERAEVS